MHRASFPRRSSTSELVSTRSAIASAPRRPPCRPSQRESSRRTARCMHALSWTAHRVGIPWQVESSHWLGSSAHREKRNRLRIHDEIEIVHDESDFTLRLPSLGGAAPASELSRRYPKTSSPKFLSSSRSTPAHPTRGPKIARQVSTPSRASRAPERRARRVGPERAETSSRDAGVTSPSRR